MGSPIIQDVEIVLASTSTASSSTDCAPIQGKATCTDASTVHSSRANRKRTGSPNASRNKRVRGAPKGSVGMTNTNGDRTMTNTAGGGSLINTAAPTTPRTPMVTNTAAPTTPAPTTPKFRRISPTPSFGRGEGKKTVQCDQSRYYPSWVNSWEYRNPRWQPHRQNRFQHSLPELIKVSGKMVHSQTSWYLKKSNTYGTYYFSNDHDESVWPSS